MLKKLKENFTKIAKITKDLQELDKDRQSLHGALFEVFKTHYQKYDALNLKLRSLLKERSSLLKKKIVSNCEGR